VVVVLGSNILLWSDIPEKKKKQEAELKDRFHGSFYKELCERRAHRRDEEAVIHPGRHPSFMTYIYTYIRTWFNGWNLHKTTCG
jgi:hypothetical protein